MKTVVIIVKKLAFRFSNEKGGAKNAPILLLVLTFCVILCGVSVGEVTASAVVTFQDPNLDAAVHERLGIPAGEPITTDHMLTLIGLSAPHREIQSLAGLEYAVNLKYLYLNDNQISDIAPLAGLTSLNDLILGGNQISDISSLAGLTNLKELSFSSNQLTDLSPLAGLTNIRCLVISGAPVSDITPLAGLSTLEDLSLSSNQISDISPLVGLTRLTHLTLLSNQISDLSPLAGLTQLQELVLWHNAISDIGPLAGLTNLVSVDLGSNNEISDISPLAGLTNLEYINLNNNHVSDLSPLAGLTNLYYLGLYTNQISDIRPLVANSGLGSGDYVEIEYNYLDLSTGSQAMEDILTLQGRGASVGYSPQYPTYTLGLTVNPSYYPGDVAGAGTYPAGRAIPLTATQEDGWEFIRWTNGNGATISTEASFVYTMPSNNVMLTAHYKDTTIPNIPPVIVSITPSLNPVPLGPIPSDNTVTMMATFTDQEADDSHTATWDWGDGSTPEAASISGLTITGSHHYATIGAYLVILTLCDGTNTVQDTYQYVVVYNPLAGYVAGHGQITSPAGAYIADPSMTGSASFGFSSKYVRGTHIPDGNTRFRFHVADLNFVSTGYEWLLISGAKASYKGVGTINGQGSYKFMLSAIDADKNAADAFTVDRFRIRIWTDNAGAEQLIYDNGIGNDVDLNSATNIDKGEIDIRKDAL